MLTNPKLRVRTSIPSPSRTRYKGSGVPLRMICPLFRWMPYTARWSTSWHWLANGPPARTNLRQPLHHLKRALPAEGNWLETTHFAVRWRQDATCSIDVVDFQAAIADAASARAKNDRAREFQSLTSAAQVYEGDLLPGLYDDWITPLREEYRKLL